MTVHQFLDLRKNPQLYEKWVTNLNKNAPVKIAPTNGSRLCSQHFSSEMIIEDRERVILKPNAIPTIFQCAQVCVNHLMATSCCLMYDIYIFLWLICIFLLVNK